MGIYLSDAEVERLSGLLETADESDLTLSSEARVLYVLVLRPSMDYRTGLVGRPAKISLSGLMRRLRVCRPSRSPLGNFSPSPKQMRGYLAELERAGLVERQLPCGKNDPLVYLCLLARTDLFRPPEEGQKKGKGSGANGDNSEPLVGKGLQGCFDVDLTEEGLAGDSEEGHISEISAKSNLDSSKNINIYNARELDFSWRSRQSEMSQFWSPDSGAIRFLVDRYGFSDAFVRRKVSEVRLYWCERGVDLGSWDLALVQHMERCLGECDSEYLLAAQWPEGRIV